MPPNIETSTNAKTTSYAYACSVSWRPPLSEGINGVLKGFLINIRTNQSATEDRNITTNERATSVTLYRLVPDASNIKYIRVYNLEPTN